MIIYCIYAAVPKKVFIDSVSGVIPNTKDWSYDDETEKYTGLYAWTKKKSLFNDFMNIRSGCKYYIPLKKDFSKDEYMKFKEVYSEYKLGYYEYDRGDTANISSTIFPSTLFEFLLTDSTEGYSEMYYNYMPEIMVDYHPFNQTLIDALDAISYTTEYDLMIGGDPECFTDDETTQRSEYAEYNKSYGFTVFGRRYFDICADKLQMLIQYIKSMIY